MELSEPSTSYPFSASVYANLRVGMRGRKWVGVGHCGWVGVGGWMSGGEWGGRRARVRVRGIEAILGDKLTWQYHSPAREHVPCLPQQVYSRLPRRHHRVHCHQHSLLDARLRYVGPRSEKPHQAGVRAGHVRCDVRLRLLLSSPKTHGIAPVLASQRRHASMHPTARQPPTCSHRHAVCAKERTPAS